MIYGDVDDRDDDNNNGVDPFSTSPQAKTKTKKKKKKTQLTLGIRSPRYDKMELTPNEPDAPIDGQAGNAGGLGNERDSNSSGRITQITSVQDWIQVFKYTGLRRFKFDSWVLHESSHNIASNKSNFNTAGNANSGDNSNSGNNKNNNNNDNGNNKGSNSNSGQATTVSPRHIATGEVLQTYWKTLAIITIFSFGLKYARRTRKLILTFQGQELGFSDDKIGYVNSYGYIPDFTMFAVAGYIMDRWGRKASAIPSLIGFMFASLWVAFCIEYWQLIVVSILYGIADGFGIGILMTIGADLAPSGCKSQFLGLYRTAGKTADIIGPLIIGALCEHLSIFWGCISCIIVAGISTFWVIFFVKEPSKYKQLMKDTSTTSLAGAVSVTSSPQSKEITPMHTR